MSKPIIELPTFKFSKEVTLKSVADALKPMEYANFKPGTQDLKLHSISATGEAGDPTWFKLVFFFTGPDAVKVTEEKKTSANGKEYIAKTAFDKDGKEVPSINQYSMIPTENILYMCKDGKPRPFALKNLVELLLAFGITVVDFKKDLTKIFGGDLKAFIGKKVSVTLGYEGNRIVKKDDMFFLVDKTGKLLTLALGDNSFVSKESAEAGILENSIEFDENHKYIKILNFNPSKETQDIDTDAKADESTEEWD